MFLFILGTFAPITIGYNIRIFNDKESRSTTSHNNGLMDSAWPMFSHDVRHTGRSPYGVTGNASVEKWKFWMKGLVINSPAIDENGTIYIGSARDNCLFAIYPDGTEKWRFDEPDERLISSPAIAKDGTIYIGSLDRNLYAVYPNGTKKWKFAVGGGIFSSPTIGDDGTIYFGVTGPDNKGRIHALNPDGTEKWHYDTGFWVYSSAALDDSGIIYIGSHDYHLYALYPNGTLKWRFKAGEEVKSPPAIGDDGTIYFGSWDDYLYALYSNGTLKWKFDCYSSISSSPAIGADGSIYVGTYSGKVFSVDMYGNENWRFQTGDYVLSSPAIDKNGVVYVGSFDGALYALNPDGTLWWKFFTGGYLESSPAIGENGIIYFVAELLGPDSPSYLYAIEVIDDNPPEKPGIDGQISGKINTEYAYTVTTSDPEEDNVSYYIDWGDKTDSGWTEFVPSGTSVSRSHSWEWSRSFTIKVMAKDDYGAQSDWSELTVTMPRNRVSMGSVWLRFLDMFPILQRILEMIK